jgi:hypothetical protein
VKKQSRETIRYLEELPNVGKAVAADLRLIGIESPQQLAGQDPIHLYEELCRTTGTRHDPCMIDTFVAIVHFMDTGEAKPWWHFTARRKAGYKAGHTHR